MEQIIPDVKAWKINMGFFFLSTTSLIMNCFRQEWHHRKRNLKLFHTRYGLLHFWSVLERNRNQCWPWTWKRTQSVYFVILLQLQILRNISLYVVSHGCLPTLFFWLTCCKLWMPFNWQVHLYFSSYFPWERDCFNLTNCVKTHKGFVKIWQVYINLRKRKSRKEA